MYDAATHVWIKALDLSFFVMEIINAERMEEENDEIVPKKKTFRLLTQYFGFHQRFFRQLILSFKVDMVVEETKEWLANDFTVVFGIQTTGEVKKTYKFTFVFYTSSLIAKHLYRLVKSVKRRSILNQMRSSSLSVKTLF